MVVFDFLSPSEPLRRLGSTPPSSSTMVPGRPSPSRTDPISWACWWGSSTQGPPPQHGAREGEPCAPRPTSTSEPRRPLDLAEPSPPSALRLRWRNGDTCFLFFRTRPNNGSRQNVVPFTTTVPLGATRHSDMYRKLLPPNLSQQLRVWWLGRREGWGQILND